MAKPKGWRPLTDDEKQDIIRRYAAGELLTALAADRRGPHVYCGIKCANGARRGQPMSAEHKAKISAGLTGIKRPRTPEHSAKIGAAVSKALKGKPKSPEHIAKVAAANRGRTVSAETRAKISASLKRYNSQIKIESEPARERRRPAETTGPATLF